MPLHRRHASPGRRQCAQQGECTPDWHTELELAVRGSRSTGAGLVNHGTQSCLAPDAIPQRTPELDLYRAPMHLTARRDHMALCVLICAAVDPLTACMAWGNCAPVPACFGRDSSALWCSFSNAGLRPVRRRRSKARAMRQPSQYGGRGGGSDSKVSVAEARHLFWVKLTRLT